MLFSKNVEVIFSIMLSKLKNKEYVKNFKDFNESNFNLPIDNIDHIPLSKKEYDEFYERVSDYMIEWNDKDINYEFMKHTFEYETPDQLSDPSIMRLRIFYKNIGSSIDTGPGYTRVLKTEKSMEISKLINDCTKYLINRICKSYNILYINSRHWDPFNHAGAGDKRWVNDKFYGNYDCLIRFIKFKLTSKK